MEMVRWLIGNRIVQVAWGLGLLAVLLSWIFGGKSADHSADADSGAKVEQVAEASVEVKSEPVAEVKQEAEATTSGVQAAVATGAAATVATAAVATQSIADTTEATTEAVEVAAGEATEAAADTVAETTEVVVTEAQAVTETVETEAAGEVVESETEATSIAGELSEKSSDDLLTMAREAYWNNGLDEAAEIYTALIEREPSVIEHKGELGNVFWRQGYPKKAAELYAEIAEPMIKAGNGERVSNMVGFIGLFFPEKAANIRTLLDQ